MQTNLKITLLKKDAKVTGYAKVEKSVSKTVRVMERNGEQVLAIPDTYRSKDVAMRTILAFARHAVRVAKEQSIPKIVFDWADLVRGLDLSSKEGNGNTAHNMEQFVETLVSHIVAAEYDFVSYKTTKVIGGVAEVAFANMPAECADAVERGEKVGKILNGVRTVANTPANDLTPELLAKKAAEMFKGVKNTKVTVLDTKKMRALKMGLVLGVAQGSQHAPKFIIVEYTGSKNKKDAPLVLIGKGVTFDSGGIQLKPGSGSSIHEMHMDMSGGVVCLGALKAIAELGLKKNVVCIVPAVENMISKESYRPGDILTSMSGKTVEILNTDAEGRLILADAITYAHKFYKPKMIVDVATLTGASIVALGTAASAFMTNKPAYVMDMMAHSEAAGEYHWPLPLWGEYAYVLKSERADMANIASTEPRSAGTIAGGVFLYQFLRKECKPEEEVPWVHIDMAPRMDSNGRDQLGKGSTGEPMRTLIQIARSL